MCYHLKTETFENASVCMEPKATRILCEYFFLLFRKRWRISTFNQNSLPAWKIVSCKQYQKMARTKLCVLIASEHIKQCIVVITAKLSLQSIVITMPYFSVPSITWYSYSFSQRSHWFPAVYTWFKSVSPKGLLYAKRGIGKERERRRRETDLVCKLKFYVSNPTHTIWRKRWLTLI